MSQEQVGRLQALLERVQRNARRPRAHAAASVVASAPQSAARVIEPPAPEPEPEPVPVPIAMPQPTFVEETTLVRPIEEPAPEGEVELEVAAVSFDETELLEDEIVDITDASADELGAVEVEEPPASSRRPIAASMTEALAEAAEIAEPDEGREIPLKTPPPESGPQAAPIHPEGLAVPPVPRVDELHDVEVVSGPQPTAAQLGATVELEQAAPAELELGEPVAEAPPIHAVRDETPAAVPLPEPVQPEVVRPALSVAATPSAFVHAARTFHPESFIELIDASLGLGS